MLCLLRDSPNARCTCTVVDHASQSEETEVGSRQDDTLAQSSEPSTALPLESAVSSLLTVPHGWDVLGTPSSRRGAVASWRAFAAAKWRNKHPWIVVGDDGVYCLYCKAGTGLLSGSSVFVSTPFTGTRPDKLVQHEHSDSHLLHISSFAAHI